jgi:hypothetical protein
VVTLPTQEFEAGGQKFTDKLTEMLKEIEMLKQRVSVVEIRVESLESRMDILEKKVYTLEHSMLIVNRSLNDIDQRITQFTDDKDLADLRLERQKITERGQQIKRFNKQSDLADYYHALLSEMSATYIAALKIEATAANLKYADRLRGEILNAIERGTFSYPDYFPNSKRAYIFGHTQTKITIGVLLHEFLEGAKSTKEASTYRGYKKVCDGHLLPVFAKVEIQDLQPAIIRKWIRNLNCTTKTAANILTPLRAVVEQALVDQYIKENPLNSIIVDKLLNKETKKSDYKPDPFSIDEINTMLKFSEGQVRHLFQFAFFSG